MSLLKCDNCGLVFDEEDCGTMYDRIGPDPMDGNWMNICPECGSSDLIEMETCQRCDMPFQPDEYEYCYCPECRSEAREWSRHVWRDFRLVFGDTFDDLLMDVMEDTQSER